MTTLAFIASDAGLTGERRLLNGDRAAVAWGIALAGGACRVACPEHDLEAAAYARALGATITRWDERQTAAFEIAIIGPAVMNMAGDEFAGRLAESAGAELLFDVLAAERVHDAWKITCDAGRGARDVVTVRGPVVLVVSPDVARPRYVSAFRRTSARRDVESAGVLPSPAAPQTSRWQPLTPRTPRPSCSRLTEARTRADHAFNMQQSSAAPAQVMITDPPPIAAQLLLRFLVHRSFVTRSLDRLTPLAAASTTQPPAAIEQPPAVESLTGDDARFTTAAFRGPRHREDTAARLSRRPRLETAVAAQLPQRINAMALQRRPRRIGPASKAGLRGPFRIAASASAAAAPTAAQPRTDVNKKQSPGGRGSCRAGSK